jgi:hypothetical protein
MVITMNNVTQTRNDRSTLYSERPSTLPAEIIQAYGQLIQEHVDMGWDPYWFTFMFDHLPGSIDAKLQQMHQEIIRMYGKLASRVVRKPKSLNWAHFLPRGVFFPDVPAFKNDKSQPKNSPVNSGLHMHGIVLASKEGRLKNSLDEHFHEHRDLYQTCKMYRIYVEPIRDNSAYVTDYGGKAIKNNRFSIDDILILPKTTAELSQVATAIDSDARAARDLQSRYNLSDELARDLLADKRKASVGWH